MLLLYHLASVVVGIVSSQLSFSEHGSSHRISDMLIEPVYHLKQVKHHAGDGCISDRD